jgi:hypothetical protein
MDVVGKNGLCCEREVCSHSRCHIHIKANSAPRETLITPNKYHLLKAIKGDFPNMLFIKVVTSAAFLVCYSYSLSISSKDVAIVSRDVVVTSPETSLSVRVTTDLSPRLAGSLAVVLAAISGTVAVGSAACISG